MSGYELAAYEPAQRDDYLRLLDDAWGEAALSGAEFDWWFSRNPEGSLMSVARDDGRVIGVAAHSFYRMALAGGKRPATFSVHATTDPVGAGTRRLLGLERNTRRRQRLEAQQSCSHSHPRRPQPLFLGPLGWTQVGKLRIWARPLPRVRLRRGRAEQIQRFEFDADAASGWPNHIVRDAEYLNWRYLDSPRDYVAYRAGGGMRCSATSAIAAIRLRSWRTSSDRCGRCCGRASPA